MNKIAQRISAAAHSLAGGPTGTSLDILGADLTPYRVAERLMLSDQVPASRAEVADAFLVVSGHAPDSAELADVEPVVRSFGFTR